MNVLKETWIAFIVNINNAKFNIIWTFYLCLHSIMRNKRLMFYYLLYKMIKAVLEPKWMNEEMIWTDVS